MTEQNDSATIRLYARALRIDRWPRSASILLGSGFAWLHMGMPVDTHIVWRTLLAFISTFAVALFNYSINEITDAPFDRHHPGKKHRPLASGKIRSLHLFVIGFLLLVSGVLIGFFLHQYAFYTLLTFACAGIVYNVPPLRFKDIPIFDALVESFNNPIRFSIGWYALVPSGHPPLEILIIWWAFGAFLMYSKRLSEKRLLHPDNARLYRKSLERYSTRSLTIAIWTSASIVTIALAYYAYRISNTRLYTVIPVVIMYCLWIFSETLTHSGRVEEPEALFRKPVFILLTLILAFLFLRAFMS